MGQAVVREASAREVGENGAALVDLLSDAVDDGAGLGFLPPLDRAEGEAWVAQVAADVARGTRVALLATLDGALAGTAQLDLCTRPNGLHRAECQKVMVHRRFRRRGVGAALMRAVDAAAIARGRTTLHLDTFADQGARRLYEKAGWVHAGDVPAFARTATGELGATSIYYRLLG
ncbi:MAG TPA: GNAT family N-acetyltransferase [Candidatus Thermoplasmatota archaeon]|nr:GNAT family N-acetyltransferase [Candidatus Thermoplasmatota archaeon]